MSDMQLGAVESKFADILWAHEPISSAEVVRGGAEVEEVYHLYRTAAAVRERNFSK